MLSRKLFTLITILGSSLALAAPLELRPIGTLENLTLEATDTIRYTVDPLSGTLVIPEAGFLAQSKLPEGLKWAKRGTTLVILLPEGAVVGLSPDTKRLYIRSGDALPTKDDTPIELVMPSNPNNPSSPSQTINPLFLPLSNADPRAAAALLSRLLNNGTRVEVDDRNRTLIVLAPSDQQDSIKQLVAVIDQERPQVMFEAEILEINQDTTQALGIDYTNLITLNFSELIPKTLLSLGKIIRKPLSDKALTIGIKLLKSSGSARVLAQPRVTTLDGLEAKINSTQTNPILTTNKDGAQSIVNLTTGITLRMTPKVAPDGTVEALLNITVSNPTGTTANGAAPFSTREASTTVRVRNGEAIAIGGLLETRTSYSEDKVPFLGDLPFIGSLFTSSNQETHHTDLIILVTPRLVLPSIKEGP